MPQSIIDSPIGPLFIEASERGIRGLSFLEATQRAPVSDGLSGESSIFGKGSIIEEARRQLDAYFDGRLRRFGLPLDVDGTPFQKRVWQAIADIPYGETASYAEVAATVGAPNAYRAAGSACGANRVIIVVPCHRVVGSDRGLHGFGGGLDLKAWLLRHEGSLLTLPPGLKKAPTIQPALV